MINIIAIVRDVLFIIWLFWKIQMVMDGLRYFQVSLKSVQNQFRSFGPLSSQWNLLALVCSNISRLTLFSNTMLHITTFTISEHDFITFLKPNCLMIGRRFIGLLTKHSSCWNRFSVEPEGHLWQYHCHDARQVSLDDKVTNLPLQMEVCSHNNIFP